LFRIFGIQLSVHSTFFLLLAYVAWEGWRDPPVDQLAYPIYGSLINVVALAVFFTCVVLHELGHALTARRYGIGVPRILLLPIGGMAEFDSIPRKPSRELAIALAGPAVNFAIIAVLMIFAPFPSEQLSAYLRFVFGSLGTTDAEIRMGVLQQLMAMNFIMGCFNLIPVFPMDGGRVLRALLATRLRYVQATFYAATVAKVLAVAAIIAAISHGRIQLTVLFAFIFFAGEMEYRAVKRREWEDAKWRQMLADLHAATTSSRTLRDAPGQVSKP
jgi:Zn-dependent protease